MICLLNQTKCHLFSLFVIFYLCMCFHPTQKCNTFYLFVHIWCSSCAIYCHQIRLNIGRWEGRAKVVPWCSPSIGTINSHLVKACQLDANFTPCLS